MNVAEKILVVIDSEVSYNLCPGGKGGFGYINNHPNKNKWVMNGLLSSKENMIKKIRYYKIMGRTKCKREI